MGLLDKVDLKKLWFIQTRYAPIPEVSRTQMASRLSFGTQGSGRYELDDRGLRLYDPDGNLVGDLKTLDGSAFLAGTFTNALTGTRLRILRQATQADPNVILIEGYVPNNTSPGLIRFEEDELGLEAPHDAAGWSKFNLGVATTNLFTERFVIGDRFGGDNVDMWLQERSSAPATPTTNYVTIYSKDKSGTSALYIKNDAGTEYELGPIATHTHTESEITDFAHTHGAGDLPAPPPTNVFLGRTLVQAATWSNAPTDGWEDWGGASPLSVTVTKAAAGTKLLVEYGFSVFRSTAGGAMNYAIHDSVTATRYDQITGFVNGVAEHEGFTGQALISGLSAASHTLKLQIDNTTAGGNVETAADDYGWITVSEVA